ncbi:copper resistance protein B [Sphingopyxis sp. PAMC25046]|uniref:copper resistance protein B n=1 Tax=Sphingopyxis sp. PAMC25046 TaxID=2565556 RepID=UPI00109E019F|nr:copper resistance protein B [Sphingopyxis sp. PAMC25046]QCB56126.1 copper resistance protein B [Sphingopyxis sp. PAMC25046]
MRRASMLLAGLSALALAGPAVAQSDPHAGHGAPQPSMQEAPPPEAKEQSMNGGCTAEHAAMGHCTMADDDPDHDAHGDHAEPAGPAPAEADPHAGHAMAPAAQAAAGDPACPPEHAAMGHCTPDVAPPPQSPGGATGTDLPPGDAPAPPPPDDWYADRVFSKAAMDHSRHEMMRENGGQTFGFVTADLEYQARKGRDGFSWEGEAWYGGDIDRLTIKSEGESTIGEGLEEGEAQLLYSRAIGPYFNAQAGVRQDFGPGPDRSYATVAIEGLAPYWFEVGGALFLSDKGDLLARIEGEYDQRITQRLVLQPAVEANFALQDVPANGIGSGLSDVELGLRLRYEIVREFAPYIGVEWTRQFGDTARFARAAGEDPSSVALVMGVRAWF